MYFKQNLLHTIRLSPPCFWQKNSWGFPHRPCQSVVCPAIVAIKIEYFSSLKITFSYSSINFFFSSPAFLWCNFSKSICYILLYLRSLLSCVLWWIVDLKIGAISHNFTNIFILGLKVLANSLSCHWNVFLGQPESFLWSHNR